MRRAHSQKAVIEMDDEEDRDNVFDRIERALNELAAETRVQNALVVAAIGQIAGNSRDWRERLEVMRANAQTVITNYEFSNSDDDLGPFRDSLSLMLDQRFNEVFDALKAREEEQ